MPLPPVIAGFNSSNKVPGVYGETVYGAGNISAASIPLRVLLVGTMLSGGSMTPNSGIQQVLSNDAADAAVGAGGELALGAYAALSVPGAQVWLAPTPEAAGAAAASIQITISGSWTVAGSANFRIHGQLTSVSFGATDTPSTVATALASQFNADPRRPYVASATGAVVTVTIKSKGARGNQYVAFQDLTYAPAGFSATMTGAAWAATTAYATGAFVVPTTPNGFYYKATTGGTSGASQPTFPTTLGATVVDGSVTFTAWGQILTGGGVQFAGGVGVESVSTLLGLLLSQQFDRIAFAQTDSSNEALWSAQLATQAGPAYNFTQHAVAGLNGSLTAASSLATTTLNAYRAQLLWFLNGETNPFVQAAWFAAYRSVIEQSDPCASYDDVVVPIAPQSQPADWSSNAVLQAALNAGLTPIYTAQGGAKALICRSVITHTLTNGQPDYRTFDTSDAYVPDFVRKDIGLLWSTGFKPNNPRVDDDPPSDQRSARAGVATPKTWNPQVEKRLRDFEKGILASNASGSAAQPNVAPIISGVDNNKPATFYSGTQRCLITAIPVIPAANNHQLGVSVRQVAST